jgi:hypothetical protein
MNRKLLKLIRQVLQNERMEPYYLNKLEDSYKMIEWEALKKTNP